LLKKNKNKSTSSVLYLEDYSIIQLVFFLFTFTRSQSIYFHYKPFPQRREVKFIKNIVLKSIKLFNHNCELKFLDNDIVLKKNWESNHAAATILVRSQKNIESLSLCKLTSLLLKDQNVVKCYQSYIVNHLSSKILFYSTAKILNDMLEDSEILTVIPLGKLQLFAKELSPYFQPIQSLVPRFIFIQNFIHNFCLNICSVLFLLLNPLIFILSKLNNIGVIKKKISGIIASPIIWGFSEDSFDKRLGRLRPAWDDYLYDERINYGEIVHIFSRWPLPPDSEKESKRIMRSKGIPYINLKDYILSTGRLLYFVKIQLWTLFKILPRVPIIITSDFEFLICTIRIQKLMFEQLLEFDNVEYKVYLRRDDYSIEHIVATIMSEQIGRKVVALHHVGITYDLPSLAFVHVHTYITYGRIYEEKMKDFWKDLTIKKIGRIHIDWIANIFENKSLVQKKKDELIKHFGNRKYTLLIIFPGANNIITLKQKWDEMFKALTEISKTDIDVNILLRFKVKKDFDNVSHLQRFKKLSYQDSRFIIDFDLFTTQELMAVSDVIIAHSASFSINEALITSAKVFIVNFLEISSYYFSDYGSDLVLNYSWEIVDVFKALGTDYCSFNVDWEKLRKDANSYSDSNNLDRLRSILLETI